MEWNASPEIFSLGAFHLRWYGVLFATGFLIGFKLLTRIFQTEGKSERDANSVLTYMVIGTLVGARLGHCLFYEPEFYLSDPLRILKIWEGGLASHGATLGIVVSIWLYSRKHAEQSIIWVLDRVSIMTPIGCAFIRLGNFFNSEIIGKPTDVPWAIIFSRVDAQPRHPAQLYEALFYFILYFVLNAIYMRKKRETPPGLLVGCILFSVYLFRIFVEFVKEPQVKFEQDMAFNMGQWLSVPFVLGGAYLIIRTYKRPVRPH